MIKLVPIMPLLMTIIGAFFIGYQTFPILFWGDNWSIKIVIILFACIYAVWMLLESKVTKGELKKEADTQDNFTMELAAITKLSLLVSFFAENIELDYFRITFSFCIAIIGILIRISAINTLGAFYSHRIRIPTVVIDSGMYQIIRHPAYLGTAIAHLGFTGVFLNIYSGILLQAWFIIVIIRTVVEENALKNCDIYQDYCAKVKYKLIPKIW